MHRSIFSKIQEPSSFARLCLEDSRYEKYRSFFVTKTYGTGECIHEEGAEITHLGIVTGGVLKAVTYSRDGQELCNAYFEEEDSFPEFLYLSGNRCYTYMLYVEKKAAVVWIPIDILEEMLTQDAQLMSALLCYVSQRGLKNQLYLNCLNYQTIRQRIAYWIVGIQRLETEHTESPPHSQRIFANLLHVSRSSLNQELKQMEREGYFSLDKDKMYRIHVEKLRELL